MPRLYLTLLTAIYEDELIEEPHRRVEENEILYAHQILSGYMGAKGAIVLSFFAIIGVLFRHRLEILVQIPK